MNIEISVETRSKGECNGHLVASYECPECGWWNELNRLSGNPDRSVVATLPEEEVHEELCHKCGAKETMVLRTRIKDSE